MSEHVAYATTHELELSNDRKRYDPETLQPEGNYIETRRHVMQALNYRHLRKFQDGYTVAMSQHDKNLFEEPEDNELGRLMELSNHCL